MTGWLRLVAGMTIVRVVGQAFELVAWTVLARRLGPSSFGAVAVAFLVARWGALVADWGAAQRGGRDVALDDGSAAQLLRWRRTLALVGTVAFVAAAVVVGRAELAPIAAVILNGGLAREWVAVGRGRPLAASAAIAVRGAVMFGGAFVVMTTEGAATLLGGAYVAATMMSLILIAPPDRVHERGTASPRLSAWALVLVLGAQVYTSADTILLELLRTTREAGIYSALYRIPSGVTMVVGLTVAGLVPAITRQVRDGTVELDDVRRAAVRGGIGAGIAVAVMTPIAVLAVPQVFGSSYDEGRPALAVLLLATAVATASAPLGAVLVAAGAERDVALIVLGGAVANIVANIAVIPAAGMTGAGVTTLATESMVYLLIARAAGARREHQLVRPVA